MSNEDYGPEAMADFIRHHMQEAREGGLIESFSLNAMHPKTIEEDVERAFCFALGTEFGILRQLHDHTRRHPDTGELFNVQHRMQLLRLYLQFMISNLGSMIPLLGEQVLCEEHLEEARNDFMRDFSHIFTDMLKRLMDEYTTEEREEDDPFSRN